MEHLNVHIKENSWMAAVAAFKLRSDKCALVIGSSIYLHRASKEELMNNEAWLRHEICHVRQWRRRGYLYFLLHYLWLSLISGYYRNSYEEEARVAESNPDMLANVIIV
jgi:hypothetical protein